MQDDPEEKQRDEVGQEGVPESVAAAGNRADAIMENLAEILAADGPDVVDALRSADRELSALEPCFDPMPWLLPALDGYRGLVRQELWQRLGDPADLDAACELLLSAVAGPEEPDEGDVFELLSATGDRLQERPSAHDRDTFITWGSWLVPA